MRYTASIAGISVMLLTIGASAQEKKVERSELPPAVAKTVGQVATGATIRGFSTEVENEKRVYEAELVVDGHTRDVEIASDGTVNEVEEEVSFDSLPDGVKSALSERAGAAKIVKVESLTKHDKLVVYEAATLRGTKKGEVQVGPNGERLAHEE